MFSELLRGNVFVNRDSSLSKLPHKSCSHHYTLYSILTTNSKALHPVSSSRGRPKSVIPINLRWVLSNKKESVWVRCQKEGNSFLLHIVIQIELIRNMLESSGYTPRGASSNTQRFKSDTYPQTPNKHFCFRKLRQKSIFNRVRHPIRSRRDWSVVVDQQIIIFGGTKLVNLCREARPSKRAGIIQCHHLNIPHMDGGLTTWSGVFFFCLI